MLNENLILFNKLAQACGNRYLATKYIASQSRVLGKQSKGIILESKLITWALTGEQPYSDSELERRRIYDSDVAQLEDYLCYVDDKEVAQQVRKYYAKSLRNKHVVLDTSQTLDTYRQMRVNVILRMLWYGIPECGGYMAKIKLEDLIYVRKNVTEASEPEAADEIVATESDEETEVMTTDHDYEFIDADEADKLSEDDANQLDELFEDNEAKQVESEPSNADEEVDETEELVENATAPTTEEFVSGVFQVRKCKIYPKPSTKVPARDFTGNVEVIGKVDNFNIVRYVRAGFGTVTGYTLETFK